MQNKNPITIYAISHTDEQSLPFNNCKRTLRVVIRPNVQTEKVFLRFANYHGKTPLTIGQATIARCDKNGVLKEKPVTVTMKERPHFCLQPGEQKLSDKTCVRFCPDDYVAVSMYYPNEEKVHSGNLIDNLVLRSKQGNYSEQPSLPEKALQKRVERVSEKAYAALQTTALCEILAECDTTQCVVACLGDSVVQQGSWTVPFRTRLQKQFFGKAHLCNLGVGGGRLLQNASPDSRGLYGLSGIERFSRDLLSLSGLTHAILALGSNDIGLPGMEGVPLSELPTLEQYANAMQALAQTLREHKIKAYATTMLPRNLQGTYNEQREALRKQFNQWIRTAPCFDAVLDFDVVVSKPQGELGMREHYMMRDGLHPTPLAGLRLAQSIDLSLFKEENL